MQVGGAALHQAARDLIAEAKQRAVELAGDDADYANGVVSAGERSWTLGELANVSPEPLRVEGVYDGPAAFPFGAYVAVVEVDRELGNVRVLRLVAVDDCGVAIDHQIVEDQTRGGIMQGIGQALYEAMPYDDQGRPQAENLLDYLLPTIGELPPLTLDTTVTPNPNSALGAKGAGEAGCIGTPARDRQRRDRRAGTVGHGHRDGGDGHRRRAAAADPGGVLAGERPAGGGRAMKPAPFDYAAPTELSDAVAAARRAARDGPGAGRWPEPGARDALPPRAARPARRHQQRARSGRDHGGR